MASTPPSSWRKWWTIHINGRAFWVTGTFFWCPVSSLSFPFLFNIVFYFDFIYNIKIILVINLIFILFIIRHTLNDSTDGNVLKRLLIMIEITKHVSEIKLYPLYLFYLFIYLFIYLSIYLLSFLSFHFFSFLFICFHLFCFVLFCFLVFWLRLFIYPQDMKSWLNTCLNKIVLITQRI